MSVHSLGTHDIIATPADTKDQASNPWALFALKEVEESKKRSGEAAIGSLPHAPLRHINSNQMPVISQSTSPKSAEALRQDGVRDWQAFARSKDSKGHTFDTSTTRESLGSWSNSVDNSPSSSTKTSSYSVTYAMSVPYRDLMPDPPLCFCKKPASYVKTSVGVVYECHDIKHEKDSTNRAFARRQSTMSAQSPICAFHVHEEAWNRYRENLRKEIPLDETDDELKSCPAFNFTFCTVFRMVNTLMKEFPRVPRCYCNRPVKRYQFHHRYNNRAFFTCSNFFDCVNCCYWFAWAEDTRFVQGKSPCHDFMLEERTASTVQIAVDGSNTEEKDENVSAMTTSFADNLLEDRNKAGDIGNNEINNEMSITVPESDAGSKCSKDFERLKDGHDCDTTFKQTVLSNRDEDLKIYSQSAKNPLSVAIPSKQPTPFESKSETMTSQMDQSNDFLRLLQGANMPQWHSSEEEKANCNNVGNNDILAAKEDTEPSTVALSPPDSTRSASIVSSLTDDEEVDGGTADDFRMPLRKSQSTHLIPGAVYTRQLLKDVSFFHLSTKAALEQAERVQERGKEELRRRIQKLEEEVDKLRGAAEQGRLAMQQLARTRDQLLETRQNASFQFQRLERVNQELHVLLEEQQRRHVEAAEKLAMTEIYNEDLCEELQDLRQQIRKLTDKAAHKDSKCRVCFQEPIEFALVPCYHCGKLPFSFCF